MMTNKECNTCGQIKPLSDFGKRKNGSRDGCISKCKSCYNSYMRVWQKQNPNPERRRYAVQKGDAKRRGIPFLLSFEQWLCIWTESGHLDESGSFAGQYCM